MINLFMRPDVPPMSWQMFCKNSPPNSIAFDGYVHGGPRFSPKGPRMNCNHHEGVDRLATRATCAQTLIAIRQGLLKSFTTENGALLINAYFNDCDQDVCTTWFLLKHSHLVTSAMNPALNRLIMMEDMLDSTAGAYPFPTQLPLLKKLAWVFEPYTQFRTSGELDKKDPMSYTRVITDVELRIMQHILGEGDELELDTAYTVIESFKRWTMVNEIGAQARTGMFGDGIHSFVSVRKHPDKDVWSYVIGLMSPFIPWPANRIISTLNKAEQAVDDLWGGGGTAWGSPRVSGSKIPPKELSRILEAGLA